MVFYKKKEKKEVFGQSGCSVPSVSLVVWASFFGTVLFLVNENMVPLETIHQSHHMFAKKKDSHEK